MCRLCVPPSTADSASSAVRTTLFSGCCAVSDTPAVWLWKRIRHEAGIARAEGVAHLARPDAARGAVLRDLLEEVDVRVEEERQPRREVVDGQAALDRGLHVGEAVGERERQLLLRGRAGLADVVAGDRDRVPARHARARRTRSCRSRSASPGRSGSTTPSGRCTPSGCRSGSCRRAGRARRPARSATHT